LRNLKELRNLYNHRGGFAETIEDNIPVIISISLIAGTLIATSIVGYYATRKLKAEKELFN